MVIVKSLVFTFWQDRENPFAGVCVVANDGKNITMKKRKHEYKTALKILTSKELSSVNFLLELGGIRKMQKPEWTMQSYSEWLDVWMIHSPLTEFNRMSHLLSYVKPRR